MTSRRLFNPSLPFLLALTSVLLFSVACVHRPLPKEGDSLFPQGTYKHAVTVQVSNKAAYPLNGVLSYDSTSLKVFLLGPMNVTAAKITETFADESVKLENHMVQFEDYEDYVLSFYEVLRSFVLYPPSEDKWGNLYVTAYNEKKQPLVFVGPRKIHFVVMEYKDNHPVKFRVSHPSFTATIEEIP